LLAEPIGLQGTDALLDLANLTAWARLSRRDVPSSPIRLELYDAPQARRQSVHRLFSMRAVYVSAGRAPRACRLSLCFPSA
jgi:hypothetical protein